MTRIVSVGATSGIADEVAKIWLARASQSGEPLELVLVGRNADKLQRLAADYRIRNPHAEITTVVGNLIDPLSVTEIIEQTVGNSERSIDQVLIAHGAMLGGDQLGIGVDLTADNIQLNAISPVLFAQRYAQIMVQQGHGTLGIIGSVAGDRGRQMNYIYGAAKGLIERFAQGLQHRLADTRVRVVLIKPGPTATPMTAERAAQGEKLVPADVVARGLVRAMDRGQSVAYLPARWRIIMLVVRLIPRFLFHRTNF